MDCELPKLLNRPCLPCQKGLLQCHHCNYHTPIEKECPECRLHEPKPIGYGTEQVSEFLSQQFSNKVWCADSDNYR